MAMLSFGKKSRFRFQAEGPLLEWHPAPLPAVYAITYKQDPAERPKSHTVLYFGETENLAAQAAAINENLDRWCHRYQHNTELFVFILPMPGTSQYDRARLTNTLVAEYDPQANH